MKEEKTPKPGSMADIRERARFWGILPTYPKPTPPKAEPPRHLVGPEDEAAWQRKQARKKFPSKRTVKADGGEIPTPTGGQPGWKRKRKAK